MLVLNAFAAKVADSSVAQTDSVAEQKDSSGTQGSQVYLICDMPDDYDDPETAVREIIGSSKDSLGPLDSYVNLPDFAQASTDSVSVSADSAKAQVDSLASKSSVVDALALRELQKNIPLPRQTAYTGKGLSIGIGAGICSPTADCDCMGIWQAQFEYFYSSSVSGGVDVRFLGGDLDSDVMVMYQRYRVNVRFHKVLKMLDLYLEPVLGLENTSIAEFREQVQKHNSEIREDGWHLLESVPVEDSVKKHKENCEKMFSLDGFSLGIGGGVGVVVNDYLGFTGSVLLEYNFSRAIQLTLSPGAALDLQRIWPWAREKLLSTWLSLEVGAQRYFNRGVDDWAIYVFSGIQLGI